MQLNIIIKEAKAQGHGTGTKITLINRTTPIGKAGIIIDYKIGYNPDWAKKRIQELEEENDKWIYYSYTKVIGMTRLREQKSRYGEKRRRAGGHGYSGGDGYTEIS
jgi:hypothetical protein